MSRRLARPQGLCYAIAMSPFRVLTAATAAEVCVASAAVAILALAGAVNGWLDLLNCAAPLLIVTGLAGAAVMVATWPKSRFRVVCVGAGLAAALYGAAVSLPDAVGWLFQLGGGTGAGYRVVTANVYRNNRNPFHAIEALVDRQADAVIVEEADGSAQSAATQLSAAYPYSSACPEAGVEIWLKTPILSQGCGMATPPGSYKTWGKDFAWVRTLGPDGRPIVLAGVHLGRPYPPLRQKVERQALADAITRLGGARVLVGGDLNTVPSSFGMRRMDRLLRPLTRRTLWMPTFPGLIGTTHRRWFIPLLAIDHVYADAGWFRTKLTRFDIPGSDHFGLQVDARLR
jgi:endonuclease/exonuclease/phosphatase (EEP) superfamily protein YafD